ncbi:ADP-ribosylation factor-binding protein GGA1 isoform X2 [Acyrthosiphon pisum]|uniref:ADP-ribosylation factor-binding protein GGA1 n=1 Tax=Acyrthosiphon pisum TaxID=7029 RepID=A0A8R2D4R0_ACYPI|nr:ADP-ribosylation factor-binding protein GGA1 isoform X2 [Acyrthosiphon pisum]XP_008183809.1 ADP-ribosylation factor-binding protein GGA1 isoform X2 [Acyrthosiphon pisum]XP_016660477.1 ADP-ribosylation factor-binding protein GGA1 isoform X2 [Acyrthosiphon pisum]XP_016660478.1 ADP-ribosylation factor-binding protein GGA1 isoform X2 [Acyrthosiphon pisum]XP_029345518.1 ADP-ribosylation factor-binding protein GGA1 isoform X2 [Acyrthosiphon pisum]XP_029345519.1 ADP-ribosylation factor-binding pro|eukprot:XP_008183807.1 PREDICTED: ADP-ribosylation factor-binding protein GGA1 isoform X1 [Acyrthosiphon pisum]
MFLARCLIYVCVQFINIHEIKTKKLVQPVWRSCKNNLKRATKNSNEKIDSAAMIAFSGFVQRDPECAPLAAKCILAKIHSMQEWEALQALHLLDICMQTGSASFQAEVGKFRFLNELIRLVSPNCNGIHTPELIKNKIIELLGLWSSQFPKEIKIQDALDMLKKQGVVKDFLFENMPSRATSASKLDSNKVSILNGEKSLLLQKLLKSKKSEDLKAANELIKSMVEEEEQKAERISSMLADIEITSNNVKLLSEMLKSYCDGSGSLNDLELIKELYTTVKQLEPKVQTMLSLEIPENEDTVRKIIKLNYEVNETLKIYNEVLDNLNNKKPINQENEEYLLDLSMSSVSPGKKDFLSESNCERNDFSNNGSANVKELDDFLQMSHPLKGFTPPLPEVVDSQKHEKIKDSVLNVDLFEELNILGKVILNKPNETKIDDKPFNLTDAELSSDNIKKNSQMSDEPLSGTHDSILFEPKNYSLQIKPLGDINIKLEDIIPCPDSIIVSLFDKNDISTELHLAANKPREDVTVFVVTTRSKCKLPLFNFSFQPVVPKDCRLRILPQSRTNLPIYNAFLPQETIVQIILVATLNKEIIPLKYVISYTMDGEMFTEFGETEQLCIN